MKNRSSLDLSCLKNFPKLAPAAALVLSLAGLTSACGKSGTTISIMPAAQNFQQTTAFNNKLDILFVINDQPSMSSFQTALVNSMSSFMKTFMLKGFDFKIAVATSSAYTADPSLTGYDPATVAAADFNDFNGTAHSGAFVLTPLDLDLYAHFAINAKPMKNSAGQDGRAFSSFRQALQSTRPINTGFLRADSFLAIIIVDNQDDFSGNGRCTGCDTSGRYNASTLDPVAVYIDFLNGLTKSQDASARYNVSAMTQTSAPCQGGSAMVRIADLVQRTNGVLGDICQPDFGPAMLAISTQIATLSTQFYLDRLPVLNSIRVTVGGVTVPESEVDGWTYNSDANAVQFHGSAIPSQGSSIAIDFDPITLL